MEQYIKKGDTPWSNAKQQKFEKKMGKTFCNKTRRTLGKTQQILLTDLTDVELYLRKGDTSLEQRIAANVS